MEIFGPENDFPGRDVLLDAIHDMFRRSTYEQAIRIRFYCHCAKILAMYDAFRDTFNTLDSKTLAGIVDAAAGVSTCGEEAPAAPPAPVRENPETANRIMTEWRARFHNHSYRDILSLVGRIMKKFGSSSSDMDVVDEDMNAQLFDILYPKNQEAPWRGAEIRP